MDTELCVYLGAGRFTIIISVHFHDNRGSQSGAKYDDKLMHTNIVLHGSVVKQWGLSPHHIYSGPRPLLRQPENQHLSVLTTTMGRSGWMYQHSGVSIGI